MFLYKVTTLIKHDMTFILNDMGRKTVEVTKIYMRSDVGYIIMLTWF